MELEQIIRIAYLISRRFTDTLSEEEGAELEHWLAAGEQNRRMLEEIKRKHFFTQQEIQHHLYNSKDAFLKVQKRRRHHLRRIRIFYGSVAAVVILVVGIAVSLLLPGRTEQPTVMVANDFPAGESKATLTLASGIRMELGQTMTDSIVWQEGIRLDASGEEIKYDRERKDSTVSGFNTLEVPRKGEFRLVLADGTKVWMNAESRLKYPVAFSGKERRVYLEGEAYFEVSKNKEMPFIVDMGKASIQVLGTSFNARAYRDETNICATLAEGQIQMNAGEKNVILRPEEQGVFELSTGNLSRKKVDINLYTGWKDGRFVFQEQTLEEMMNTLSRWYDIEVFFANSAVRVVTFSGNLKRYESFDKIIELLEMTEMAHFKVTGNSILISK